MEKGIHCYKKILAAVDLSKCSVPIINKSKQIATQHNAILEVVHVVSLVMPSFSYSTPSKLKNIFYIFVKNMILQNQLDIYL